MRATWRSNNANIALLGAPVDCGGAQRGCLMGPDALRVAGIAEALSELGHSVVDCGNVSSGSTARPAHPNGAIHDLGECASWIEAIAQSTHALPDDAIPVFMGGDHLMSAGTVPAMAARARRLGKPLFVLWLDAHSDSHTLQTTRSGNLHGTPVAYFSSQAGFEGHFPNPGATVAPERTFLFGIRSVDAPERHRVAACGFRVADMRRIDEEGVAVLLRSFLDEIRSVDGALHVSLDVDFLDPTIAPAVGTTVPGGASYREAHLTMEMLSDSGLVTSVDVAELNPFLDERGRTATLLVDLVASLFGRQVFDRPTRSF